MKASYWVALLALACTGPAVWAQDFPSGRAGDEPATPATTVPVSPAPPPTPSGATVQQTTPVTPAPAPPQAAAPEVTVAVIDHSASATSPPFRLTVWPGGRCLYQQLPLDGKTYPLATREKSVPKYLASQFFVDLNQARPLIQYPTCDGTPTLDFGFVETVQYQGQATPNLACFGLSPHLGLVAHDVRTLEQYMGIGFALQI